jgi:hypothetical protein
MTPVLAESSKKMYLARSHKKNLMLGSCELLLVRAIVAILLGFKIAADWTDIRRVWPDLSLQFKRSSAHFLDRSRSHIKQKI